MEQLISGLMHLCRFDQLSFAADLCAVYCWHARSCCSRTDSIWSWAVVGFGSKKKSITGSDLQVSLSRFPYCVLANSGVMWAVLAVRYESPPPLAPWEARPSGICKQETVRMTYSSSLVQTCCTEPQRVPLSLLFASPGSPSPSSCQNGV